MRIRLGAHVDIVMLTELAIQARQAVEMGLLTAEEASVTLIEALEVTVEDIDSDD